MSQGIKHNHGTFSTDGRLENGDQIQTEMFLNSPQDLHTILQDLFPKYIILIQSGSEYELRGTSVRLYRSHHAGTKLAPNVYMTVKEPGIARSDIAKEDFNVEESLADQNYIIVKEVSPQPSKLSPDGTMARVISHKCTNGHKLSDKEFPSVIDIMKSHEKGEYDFGTEHDDSISTTSKSEKNNESHKTPVMTTEGLERTKDYQILKTHIEGYQTQYFNEAGFYVPTQKFIKEIEGIFSKMNPEDAEDMLNRLTANLKDSNKTSQKKKKQ